VPRPSQVSCQHHYFCNIHCCHLHHSPESSLNQLSSYVAHVLL
jgi:hypothetical protein